MKKILLAIVLIICIFMFTGCSSHKVTEDSNQFGYFIKLASYEDSGDLTTFMYDPITKVIYVKISGGYLAGISVYYTMINGKPEVAIYGVNWLENNLMGAY